MGRRRQQDLTPFELTVDALQREGLGEGVHKERAVHVHGALAGEQLLVEPARGRHRPRRAFAKEVLRASPLRVAPPCPHHAVCGGCSLQHMSLEGQRAHKQGVLAADFEAAGVRPTRWLEPRSGASLGYRRRARLGVRYVRAKDEVLVGFRERMDRRFIARMNGCPVLRPPADALIEPLAALIGGLSIRHAVPQVEVSVGRDQCVLVMRVLEPLSEEDRAALLDFGRAQDVSIYVQTGGLDTVAPLDPSQATSLTYEVDGLELVFEPTSFVQVHEEMNEVLVADAMDLLDVQPGHRVLDLFCGLGNFTLPLARRGADVLGVEGDPGLVALARANADRCGLHAAFEVQDLYRAPEQGAWCAQSWDRVLLDPPRTGAEAVVEMLGASDVRRVVYVACGPESLARDAAILVSSHGFELEAAGIFDMFPHTAHFESVALLVR